MHFFFSSSLRTKSSVIESTTGTIPSSGLSDSAEGFSDFIRNLTRDLPASLLFSVCPHGMKCINYISCKVKKLDRFLRILC
jgi:hypothetical protein